MRRSTGALGALIASQLAYSRVPEGRRVGATRGIVGLMLSTSVLEGLEARGARRGAAPIAAAGATGFAVELVGVATGRPFGHYAYSSLLGPRIGGVPLLAGAAWAMLARPSWIAAGLIDARPSRRVPLAAAALTAWDVFLDPRMVRDGYWTWPGGGRYEGIPASNFLGWFVTGLGVFAVYATFDPEPPSREDDGALALYLWTWAGETVANLAVWRRPRVAIAGGLGMGVFALGALRERWARR